MLLKFQKHKNRKIYHNKQTSYLNFKSIKKVSKINMRLKLKLEKLEIKAMTE